MKAMVNGMTLHVGDKPSNINESHNPSFETEFRIMGNRRTTLVEMDATQTLQLLNDVADAIGAALKGIVDWGPSGLRDTQYSADLVVDQVALEMLRAAGVGILSEESGSENLDRSIVVIVDPLDGSTNASRGIPHYATSLCAVDAAGPLVALVVDQAVGTRWWAVRGQGAFRDGTALTRPPVTGWNSALVAVSGRPPDGAGWGQFRSFGASAIDICYVADGTVDAFIDMSPSAHGVWDYAAAFLICREVGVRVEDAQGRELIVLDHLSRRTPVAAPNGIFDQALATRHKLPL
jgi:fructose-1,6-bisphosphatase/inositol monophosphatase family enzyme